MAKSLSVDLRRRGVEAVKADGTAGLPPNGSGTGCLPRSAGLSVPGRAGTSTPTRAAAIIDPFGLMNNAT
jgi:hypothetical protein